MAHFGKSRTHPNVVLAWGDELYGDGHDPRQRLREAVAAGPERLPVSPGSHNYWVVYTPGSDDGPNHAAQNLDADPHMMLGEVHMADEGTGTVEANLRTLLEEFGHAWNVPNPLRFRHDGQTQTADARDWIENNHGAPYSGPLLVGRSCQHWGGYFDAAGSPFDGLVFHRAREDGVDRWDCRGTGELTVKPGPTTTFTLPCRGYNDLDLAIMGLLDPAHAYPAHGGELAWIEPRLVAPLTYRAGLFVALTLGFREPDGTRRIPNDFLYFGFRDDHRRLAVERTGTGVIADVRLGPDYQPLGEHGTGVALRVRRDGATYRFEYRLDDTTRGDVAAHADHVPGLFDAIDPDADAGLPPFQTLTTVTEAAPPLAIGVMACTLANLPPFLDARFYDLETYARGQHTVHPLTSLPRVQTSPGDLPPGEPVLSMAPGRGPVLTAGRAGLRVRLPVDLPVDVDPGADPCGPFSTAGLLQPPYVHDATTDRAPQVRLAPPDVLEAFGTSARIGRTLFQRSSSGAVTGVSIWGRQKSLKATALVVDDQMRRRRTRPAHDTYSVAFFVVARKRADIGDDLIARVNDVRRFSPAAFETACRGHRTLSTGLHWPAA